MPQLTVPSNVYDLRQFLFSRCPSCNVTVVWRPGTLAFRFHGSCCLWTFEAFPTDERMLYLRIKVRKIHATKNLVVLGNRVKRKVSLPSEEEPDDGGGSAA